MALNEIIYDLNNTRDSLLDEVIKYFKNSDKELSVSNIQRYFKVGYFRGQRILKQVELSDEDLKDLNEYTDRVIPPSGKLKRN